METTTLALAAELSTTHTYLVSRLQENIHNWGISTLHRFSGYEEQHNRYVIAYRLTPELATHLTQLIRPNGSEPISPSRGQHDRLTPQIDIRHLPTGLLHSHAM
jgi:hypothetical protein